MLPNRIWLSCIINVKLNMSKYINSSLVLWLFLTCSAILHITSGPRLIFTIYARVKPDDIYLPNLRVFLRSWICSYNNTVRTPSKANRLIIRITANTFINEHMLHTLVLGSLYGDFFLK